MNDSSDWYVYILECIDNSLYTGVTTDLERRVQEHNESSKGARYTRPRRPVRLVYYETVTSRSEACKRESALKKLTATNKRVLIKTAMK